MASAIAYATVVAEIPSRTASARKVSPSVRVLARDSDQPALLEERLVVVQGRDVGGPDSGHGERPAAVQRAERGGHQLTCGGEHDGPVERLGRAVGRPTDGVGAELAGQGLVVLTAGQDVNAQSLCQRDLGGQVRAAAEAVDAQPATVGNGGTLQGPVADDPGTEQRGGRLVGQAVGDAQANASSTRHRSALRLNYLGRLSWFLPVHRS